MIDDIVETVSADEGHEMRIKALGWHFVTLEVEHAFTKFEHSFKLENNMNVYQLLKWAWQKKKFENCCKMTS